MIKKAVKMKLYPGYEAEYLKRHNELWPEMREMLAEHGARSYSIFLDPEINTLFGYLEIEEKKNGGMYQKQKSIKSGGCSWKI